MKSLSAVLHLIDGKQLRVTVLDPPPPTFTIAVQPGPDRVLVLQQVIGHAVYVEPDRRKTDIPVAHDRRKPVS